MNKLIILLIISIALLSGCKENKISNKTDISQNAFSEIFQKNK